MFIKVHLKHNIPILLYMYREELSVLNIFFFVKKKKSQGIRQNLLNKSKNIKII